MKFAIANASTLVGNADVETIVVAEAHALAVFADQWDLEAPQVGFTMDPATAGLGDGDCLIVILDDADQAGELGYHDVSPAGMPYARVFARDSIAGLTGVAPETVSGEQPSVLVLSTVAAVIDHEAKEALADRFADVWGGPDGNGITWAFEVCDPVESVTDPTTIDLGNGVTAEVTLSNHVLPAFFNAQDTTGPWDHAGTLLGPFTVGAGGYAIVEQAGTVQEVFGEQLPAWRKAQHDARHPGSRTGKRWARLAAAAPPGDGPAETVSAEDAPAESAEHPEPTPVGHAIVQDNVSEPGVQITHHVDEDGEVVATHRHDPDAPAHEDPDYDPSTAGTNWQPAQ